MMRIEEKQKNKLKVKKGEFCNKLSSISFRREKLKEK